MKNFFFAFLIITAPTIMNAQVSQNLIGLWDDDDNQTWYFKEDKTLEITYIKSNEKEYYTYTIITKSNCASKYEIELEEGDFLINIKGKVSNAESSCYSVSIYNQGKYLTLVKLNDFGGTLLFTKYD